MICSKCGKQVDGVSGICSRCGYVTETRFEGNGFYDLFPVDENKATVSDFENVKQPEYVNQSKEVENSMLSELVDIQKKNYRLVKESLFYKRISVILSAVLVVACVAFVVSFISFASKVGRVDDKISEEVQAVEQSSTIVVMEPESKTTPVKEKGSYTVAPVSTTEEQNAAFKEGVEIRIGNSVFGIIKEFKENTLTVEIEVLNDGEKKLLATDGNIEIISGKIYDCLVEEKTMQMKLIEQIE